MVCLRIRIQQMHSACWLARRSPAPPLRLVFALLTETDLDPKLPEMVILRVAQPCDCRYAWGQHAAIARGVGIGDVQIAALDREERRASQT